MRRCNNGATVGGAQGGTTVFSGFFGTCTAGNATIINNGGTVSPGDDAPGTLTVNNNYTQGSNGRLLIDIAGPNAGEFSVLDVLGNANLDGILHPVLLNGFIPTVGESFTFLDYTALTGTFPGLRPSLSTTSLSNGQSPTMLRMRP